MSKKNKKIIKICGVKHEICEDAMIGNLDAMGRWYEMDSKIVVNSKLNKSLKKAVLWHEVVHVVLEGAGESELSKNESFVDKLAKILNQCAKLKIKKVKRK